MQNFRARGQKIEIKILKSIRPEGLDFWRSQVAIYTVFHEESESEVEKCQILEPGGKKIEIQILEPGSYAQTLIVVVLIVVKIFGFLVITRDHEGFEGCHQVEIFATGLPDLSKPVRDLLELTNIEFFRFEFF